jgi:hypothetical protein
MKGLTVKVGSGAFWSALARVSVQGLSFISAAVVARRLGPNAYGLMNMAQIAMGLIMLFREIGISSAVVQRRDINEEFLSSLFWANMGLGTAATLACLGSAPLFAAFFKQPQVAILLQVLSLGFLVMSATTIHVGLLMRAMSFRGLAIVEIVAAALSLAVAVTFAYSGAGVWSLVAASLANAAVSTVGIVWISRWRPGMTFHWQHIRSIVSFSAGLSGFNLVNYFARNADNILIGNDGTPKITDWGMSKVLAAEVHKSSIAGFSLSYAAPEQVSPSEFGRTDERTDIYQLGVLFYELVTGSIPFGGESIVEVGNAILRDTPTPPSEYNPDANAVEKIILKCLAKNPADRYQSAAELIDALSRYLDEDDG